MLVLARGGSFWSSVVLKWCTSTQQNMAGVLSSRPARLSPAGPETYQGRTDMMPRSSKSDWLNVERLRWEESADYYTAEDVVILDDSTYRYGTIKPNVKMDIGYVCLFFIIIIILRD